VNINNTTGNQENPHASILAGGNIVVVWVDGNTNKIVARLLGQDGTAVGTFINCNTSTNAPLNHPRAFPLVSGGFGVVWHAQKGATLSVFFQIFDKDGNKLGQETMVNTNTAINNSSPYAIEHSKTGNLIFTWDVASNQGDVIAQMYYKNDGVCKDIQVSLYGQTSVTIDFSAITYANIYLTALPTIGQLKDYTQKALAINTFVDKTKVFYVTTGQNPDSFTYATNTVDPSCTVTIAACYQTCLTCTQMGNATNNSCLQCATNLYKMSDNPNNCYSSTDIPQNYYLDTSTNTYTKCYASCLTCAARGDINNSNCSTCANNYYNLEDNLRQCYLSTDTVNGYFFNLIILILLNALTHVKHASYLAIQISIYAQHARVIFSRLKTMPRCAILKIHLFLVIIQILQAASSKNAINPVTSALVVEIFLILTVFNVLTIITTLKTT
jgi:hypothetical protein